LAVVREPGTVVGSPVKFEITPALFVGIANPAPPRITPAPGKPPYQNSYCGVRVLWPFHSLYCQ
jgi:hypothetical protein